MKKNAIRNVIWRIWIWKTNENREKVMKVKSLSLSYISLTRFSLKFSQSIKWPFDYKFYSHQTCWVNKKRVFEQIWQIWYLIDLREDGFKEHRILVKRYKRNSDNSLIAFNQRDFYVGSSQFIKHAEVKRNNVNDNTLILIKWMCKLVEIEKRERKAAKVKIVDRK